MNAPVEVRQTPRRTRVLALLNFAVFILAYIAMFIEAGSSRPSVAATLAAGVLVLAAAILSFHRRSWLRVRTAPDSPLLRSALAVAPWIALAAAIAMRGFSWTQRPASLRFFLLYAAANWSAAWCLARAPESGRSPAHRTRSAVIALAFVFGAVGIQGAAFGVTPFGCGVSAFLALFATVVLSIAGFGGRGAHLKVFAASAATVLALASVEAVVRMLRIGQNVREVDDREIARQFYSLTPPGSTFVNHPKPLDEFGPALIEINSLGIRGAELPEPRADVLLIGDSMIEARQLPWPQTLGPQLQQALHARNLSLRVVAHGMRGWSPLLEWNWYLKVGRTLQPKTVMLFFFWNDLWTAGDEASTFGAEFDRDGRPVRFNLPVDSNWIWYKRARIVRIAGDAWRRLSVAEVRRAFQTVAAGNASGALDDAAADRLARTITSPPLTGAELDAMRSRPENELPPDLRALFPDSFWPSLRPLSLWTETQRVAAGKTELELKRFAEDVRADGGRLVLVHVPNPLQVGTQECAIGRLFARVDTGMVLPAGSGLQDWLRSVAQRHGMELLDPSDAMLAFNTARPANDMADLYLRADCHWSARGHRFMAEYLAEWLQRSGAVGALPTAEANSSR